MLRLHALLMIVKIRKISFTCILLFMIVSKLSIFPYEIIRWKLFGFKGCFCEVFVLTTNFNSINSLKIGLYFVNEAFLFNFIIIWSNILFRKKNTPMILVFIFILFVTHLFFECIVHKNISPAFLSSIYRKI